MATDPIVITVVVLDANSQPTAGAHVSITPSDASGVTNGVGEIQFTLGDAKKYDITATAGNKTVTVPYYVTENGATRLVVNPVYVQQVEQQLHPSVLSSGFVSTLGIALAIALIAMIAWQSFKRHKSSGNTFTRQ